MKPIIFALLVAFWGYGCTETTPTTPQGHQANLPEGIDVFVFVAEGGSSQAADGTELHPYSTIQAGIDAVESGGAVIISPGNYKETLVITKPVALLGTASQDKSVFLLGESAGTLVTIETEGVVHLRDLTLAGGQDAILDASGEGTSVDLKDLTLSCPQVPSAEGKGHGIVVHDGATLAFYSGTLNGCAMYGLLGHDATVWMEMVTVSNHGAGGIRLEKAGAGSFIQGSTVEDNHGFGVGLFCGELVLVQNVIQTTSAPGGDGVVASVLTEVIEGRTLSSCSSELTVGGIDLAMGNDIRANHRAGVLIDGEVQALIQENTLELNGNGGVWVLNAPVDGPAVQIFANRVVDNVHVGVGVASSGRADIAGNTVLRTVPIDDWSHDKSFGDGIYISESQARVISNTVEQNDRYGVLISDTFDQACIGKDNSFTGNMAPTRWQGEVTRLTCKATWGESGQIVVLPRCEEGCLEEAGGSPELPDDCTSEPAKGETETDNNEVCNPGATSCSAYSIGSSCIGCDDDDPGTWCPNDDVEPGDPLPCCNSNSTEGLEAAGGSAM